MTFVASKSHVANHGAPPDQFLSDLVAWAKVQDDSLFEQNAASDIYSLIVGTLGPWTGILHRRAAMMEVIRCHAAFESSWNWQEGKDPNNHNPDPKTWETGILQVSFDMVGYAPSLRAYVASLGASTVEGFLSAMKLDKVLALGFYARVVRIRIDGFGPLIRREILPWLRRDAVAEFEAALVEGSESSQITPSA